MNRAAARVLEAVRGADWVRRVGRITRFVGLTVESQGPDAQLGELCNIVSGGDGAATLAEVVGFSGSRLLLMPYEDPVGIRIGSDVIATGRSAQIRAGDHLLGRVIDGFGAPLDDKPRSAQGTPCSIYP